VNHRRAGRIATGLFLLAAVLFAALLLRRQWSTFASLREGLGPTFRISPGWLAAALALATANLAWMGGAWVRLYRAGGGVLAYRRGIAIWMATNLGRYIPGKVWQLSGLALHLRRTGGSGALALSSSLGYQVVTLLTGAAVAVLTLGGDLASARVGSPLVWGAAAVVLALLLHPALLRRATRLAARLTREEGPEVGAPRGRDLGAAAAALVVSWLVYGAGFWCLLRGLWRVPPSSLPVATGVFAASYVAGYVVLLAPGGLVVREGAMTALLVALTPLAATSAAAAAVAARLWTTASELVGVSGAIAIGGRGGSSERPVGTAQERSTGEPGDGAGGGLEG
jgi:uncharacterized membrane protein YbhN (UPF0104 family)